MSFEHDFVSCLLVRLFTLVVCTLGFAETSLATPIQVYPMRSVTLYYAYSTHGGGDVIFRVADNSNVTNCEDGFWIQATSPGFDRVYTALMSSYFSGKPITVIGDSAYRWSGSTGAYCRVDAIGAQ